MALVLATAMAFPLGWAFTASRWTPVLTFFAFLAGLGVLHHVWLPRIVAARHALEAQEDPERARRQRARERRAARLGWALGIVSGSLGLAAGLWLSR